MRRILAILSVVLALALPMRAADSVLVFAAASLTDAMREIGQNYQAATGEEVRFNFAASSLLERQIEEGAPADIFFSADEAKMEKLASKNLIVPESRKSRLSNSLVVIIPSDSPLSLRSATDLTNVDIKKIALADPKAVPAGIYAKAFLDETGEWTAVENKIVPSANVRAALAAVESANAEAGIVFKTDAAISKSVKIAFEIPSTNTPAISYSMARLRDSKLPAGAGRFLDYLNSDRAGKVFVKFGFVVRP